MAHNITESIPARTWWETEEKRQELNPDTISVEEENKSKAMELADDLQWLHNGVTKKSETIKQWEWENKIEKWDPNADEERDKKEAIEN